MKKRNGGLFVIIALSIVALFAVSTTASAAVDNVRCVLWQGDTLKYHTAISGQNMRLAGVITTTDTSTIWYQWVYGDGTESAVVSLSGSVKYNVQIDHAYTGAVGTPFTAQLMVDDVDNSMANAVSDNYLVKIEENNLDARVNMAIDKGLWRLYQFMAYSAGTSGSYLTLNGQPCASWRYSSYYASPTASAIQAFMINNHKETGNFNEDPYAEAVKWGLNWLFNGYYSSTSYLMLQAINVTAAQSGEYAEDYDNDGDVDVDDTGANNIGIQVRDRSSYPAYEGGMIMDAIITTGTPNADCGRDFDGDGTNDTYKEVVQDMVDAYSWGQSESGSYTGGWRYSWNYSSSDNSVSQWASIGNIPAEKDWGCQVPQWVKDRNENWLNYSYYSWGAYGRFGYSNNACLSSTYVNSGCHATTPSGMIEMIMNGADTSDPRWIACERWMADSWSSWLGSLPTTYRRDLYGAYAFVKAMLLAQPNPVETFYNGFNWYRGNETVTGLAQKLVSVQQSDGQWDGNWCNDAITTAWGVIMLKPALFAAAPIACFTANPNPTFPGVDVTFDPSCSGHSEGGKDITNLVLFEWDWDNDGSYDESSSTPDEAVHAFPCASLPCTYPVTLRVTDDEGLTATFSLDIDITQPPHPPTADANGPYMVSLCDGDTLTLDGSGSFDIDEGQHEAGCPTCPNDTITAWDWDLTPPLTGFDDESGETVTITNVGDYFSAGIYQVGLRVSDNTEAAFPTSGEPNLTDADFANVTVYEGCICNLAARPKSGKVQLTWTDTGAASYDIYRSTEGPNTGFAKIAAGHVTTYATYLDEGLVNGTTYWYRVVTSDGCGSNAASATPTERVRR